MEEISEEKLRTLMLEILNMERRNLRSKAKSDQTMLKEIENVIIEYAKMY